MITVNELTKEYPGNKGIREISFKINEGETFGFLGPNGAGKTTTIRNLMGFIHPNRGEAKIKGLDCWREAQRIKEFVGYLPGEITFLENMTGQEFLSLIRGMHGNKHNTSQKLRFLSKRLDIDLKQSIKKMSKGTKQKVGLISILMLDPEIYIFDEPTSGLDPLMQRLFIELIQEEKARGKTIFISTHQFMEVERTCEKVGIIQSGRLIAIEDIENLHRTQGRVFEVEVASDEDITIIRNSGVDILKNDGLKLIFPMNNKLNSYLEILAKRNVKDINIKQPHLEDLFLNYYHKQNEDQ